MCLVDQNPAVYSVASLRGRPLQSRERIFVKVPLLNRVLHCRVETATATPVRIRCRGFVVQPERQPIVHVSNDLGVRKSRQREGMSCEPCAGLLQVRRGLFVLVIGYDRPPHGTPHVFQIRRPRALPHHAESCGSEAVRQALTGLCCGSSPTNSHVLTGKIPPRRVRPGVRLCLLCRCSEFRFGKPRFHIESLALTHGVPQLRSAALGKSRRRESRVTHLPGNFPAELVRRRLAGNLADFPDPDVGRERGLFGRGRALALTSARICTGLAMVHAASSRAAIQRSNSERRMRTDPFGSLMAFGPFLVCRQR